MRNITKFKLGVFGFLACFLGFAAQSEEADPPLPRYSQMAQGGVGLLQTPTARMAAEGTFSTTYSDVDQYRFWSASLQLFPWMETTVRYTDVRTRLYSPFPEFSGDQTLKDKGIDVKFRLLEESYYLPNVSVGLRDIGGTGFFESEFVTASKAYGPFDFHLGMGWGYLGAAGNITNPFCEIKDSFCERPTGFSGRGGQIDYDQFFKGKASLFGGIEYQTPIEGLRLKLEYEGNDYVNDRAGELEQDSRWNFGAVYNWNDFDLSLNYQRGNTVGFSVSYAFDMNTISQVRFDEPKRSLMDYTPAASMEELNRTRLYQALYNESGFILKATSQTGDEMIFYGTQLSYSDHNEAIERISRIIASELPKSIKRYKIVDSVSNIPLLETEVDAEAFIAAARYESLEADVTKTFKRQDPSQKTREEYRPASTSGLFYNIESFWIQTFGSPEDFFLYQGGAFVNSGYAFNQNFSVRAGLKVTLLENFDKFKFRVDQEPVVLPRVRTYVREYVTRSKVTMETAYLHWYDNVAPNVYAQAYGGYLEGMFGGVGGEVLYRPVDSSLAFGVDLNYVQQRSFENNIDFFDYKVLTGHASVYWRPKFLPDTEITISAGQFLAKDKGVNIDFAKRFDSGLIVGAYAAFTNVSAEDYGEGSFTKGFYISIPFDLLTFEPAKGRGKIPWVPISRDGGQMLIRPVKLRNMTEDRSPFYH